MPRGSDLPPGPLTRSLARILKAEVDAQGLLQKDAGRMSLISPSQMGKFLRGERVPDIEQIARICTALGLDWHEVLAEADSNK